MFSTMGMTGDKDLRQTWALSIVLGTNILIYASLKHCLLWSLPRPLHTEDGPLSFYKLHLDLCACLLTALYLQGNTRAFPNAFGTWS